MLGFAVHRFRNSFGTPLVMAMFLRLRYYQSAQTRAAFSYVSQQIDVIKGHPSCPEPVKRGLDTVRELVSSVQTCCTNYG